MAPLAVLCLPLKTVNESNGSQGARAGAFWAKSKRRKGIRSSVLLGLRVNVAATPLPLPLLVRLTRLSAGELDDDGLVSALKSVRDGCADFLGVDDKKRQIVRYAYEQEPCKRGTYGVRIEFFPKDEGGL